MRGFFALLRKQWTESRWTLVLSSAALFALSWLFVYFTARIERRMRGVGGNGEGPGPPMRMLRGIGGADMDFSSVAIEMALWNHPFIILTIAIWAIGRGSSAVAAEIERGTMDLVLSRPVGRSAYLTTQVVFAMLGLVLLGLAMIAGNLMATRYNVIQSPPSIATLLKPSGNLVALGLAMYGYTLLFSTLASVRWRANLAGSVLTLAAFILHVVVNLPTLEDWKKFDRLSIFARFEPVELVTKGETLAHNLGVLAGVGVVGIALAYGVFARRDLPANS